MGPSVPYYCPKKYLIWVPYLFIDGRVVFRLPSRFHNYQITMSGGDPMSESFPHGSSSVDGNNEGFIMPVTSAWSKEINVSDATQHVVQYTQSGEVVSSISVFEYVCNFTNRTDARHFVLGMRIGGIQLYVCNSHTFQFPAADGWASR